MSKNFYITTTLPYVNSDPHIGFAMEIVRADVIARSKRLAGFEVFFNTGTDEHGLKIHRKAAEEGVDTQAYVDRFAAKFKGLQDILGLSEINFIRTTDEHHKKAAQEFWKRCVAAGDIYKKNYKIKYCVGCELEKTESELVNGRCSIHQNLELEIIDEENYFFAASKYQQRLLDLYEKNPDFVVPVSRLNEIKAFVSRGLEDFSISRQKSKMPWGVEVPGDADHVMYVWFDALVNYISCLGWPETMEKFDAFWKQGTPTQYAGKDNLRQQTAMWQAMLMSADLPRTHQVVIDGFITVGGHKMSKSVGNVISPYDLVNEYGTDAFRYYVLRELHPFEDSDATLEKIKESYNANLANGLGNLVSRIMKMSSTYFEKPYITQGDIDSAPKIELDETIEKALQTFEINKAMDAIWQSIQQVDHYIQEQKPFTIFKTDPKKARDIVGNLAKYHLVHLSRALRPFMPDTAEKIAEALISNKFETPLFMRKD